MKQQLPQYKCHKVVSAVKIKSISYHSNGTYSILPDEPGLVPFPVSGSYLLRHFPMPGGYYVVYENGYESYSPGDAFEDGYSRIHVKRTEFLTKKDVAPKKVFIDDLEKVSAGFKPFDGQQATLIHELSDAISKVGVTYDGEQLIACIELILGKLKNIERGER